MRNGPEPPNHSGRTLVEWFESQVRNAPDDVAVTFGSASLTYAELDRRANRLARHLSVNGVRSESLVALYLPRSFEMVVGIIGVLKAGGAYVPLDNAWPRERLAFVLQDSQPAALVTTHGVRHEIPDFEGTTIDLHSDADVLARLDDGPLTIDLQPDQLAYVIYTSGSTGRPKGALITHTNVVRLFTETHAWFGFDSNDVWTLFHSYAFDFSVWELWGALLYGGRVVVVPFETSRAPDAFRELLWREGVTVLCQTPSAFRQLIFADATAQSPLELRVVIFGGEALELASLRPWVKRYGDGAPQLVNMYGITETTVHVTYRPLTREEIEQGKGSVIGRPIPDLELYILDDQGNPVSDGEVGELYVAGPGLARGYLRRDELTAERFVTGRIPGARGGRMYRTGDLVRLSEGDLEYQGRIDDQVKIRGFRIETGEVETAMRGFPGVREAVVVARDDEAGQKYLVGYFVPTPDAHLTPSDLRTRLQTVLPQYMVPAAFVMLEAVPLTANGKVDRRALPDPDAQRRDVGTQFVEPRTGTERVVADVWRDVLRLERVGVHDNFFELGGDSISIVDVAERLRRRFEQLDVVALFEHPTLGELAASLDAAGHGAEKLAAVDQRAEQRRLAQERRRELARKRSE